MAPASVGALRTAANPSSDVGSASWTRVTAVDMRPNEPLTGRSAATRPPSGAVT